MPTEKMALRVKRFNPKGIKENRILFLIGKRHTGKSVLMKDLLYHMPRPDYVLAMAPTEDTLRMFREFAPEACIFDHFDQEKLDQAVRLQKDLTAKGKKRNLLILLDDCMYQKGVLKSTSMRHIFFNGRHDNISLLCAAQYLMDIEPSIRTNIDYLFTMREQVLMNRKKLFQHYFGQFSKFDDFDKVLSACTQDYRCLVLDGTLPCAENPTDVVFWYKASRDIPEFQLCKPIFWKLSRKYQFSEEQMQRAKNQQFVVDNATIENRSSCGFTVVQTEDEHGNVV